MSSDLTALLAKQAIADVLFRYCRAMDRMDVDLGRSVWHPDGTASYLPSFSGRGYDFVAMVTEMHRRDWTAHSHSVSNRMIDVQGDRAESEAYVCAVLQRRTADAVVQTTIRGRYLDRWSMRDRWAIDHRDYVHDLDETCSLPLAQVSTRTESLGRRDTTDLSYRLTQFHAALGGGDAPAPSETDIS